MASIKIWLSLGLLLLAAPSIAAQNDETVFDKDIKVVEYKEMHYPMGGAGGLQGIVVVRLKLDDRGRVTGATALSGEPLLIRASVDNAKTWRLEPNPQKTAIIVYQFRMEGLCDDYENAVTLMSFYPPNFVVVRTCGRQSVP